MIRTGHFIFDKSQMNIKYNYIQKKDGTYRQAQLIPPVLYLALESVCGRIYQEIDHELDNSHALYAGDLGRQEVSYSKQYNLFYKEVNKLAANYPYYMKFDLIDFFRNIDINILCDYIENKTEKIFEFHIYIYKELLRNCGDNKFPIIENSTGLSYLATKVYLEELDQKITSFLMSSQEVLSFEIIRYVDDLYIFYEPVTNDVNNQRLFTNVKDYYATLLRDLSLNINSKKSNVNESKDIHQDLQQSFYEGEIYDETIDIHDVPLDYYVDFLELLLEIIDEKGYYD